MLKGKRLSILGDSISSYKGVSDDRAAHSTLSFNPSFYKEPFPRRDTYWQIIIDRLGMRLCVNNSFSGGNLSGREDSFSGVSRALNLSREDGKKPDLVIVFMGLNDMGRGVEPKTFFEDYLLTLKRIRKKLPAVKVCCVNMPDRYIEFKERTEDFNSSIKKAVNDAGEGFFIADLFNSRLNNDFYYNNTMDGLHPDADGMRIIAEIIIEAIRGFYKIS